MKFFTNRSITKKIIIVILSVMLLTFSIPKPVNAGLGGVLLDSVVALVAVIFDAGQHLLECFMIGGTNDFLKNASETGTYNSGANGATSIDLDAKGVEIGTAWWQGEDEKFIPVIQYTPEEIFKNTVPMLDINFIKPSVVTGDGQNNIAIQLRDTISGWYVAIRTLAIVGLLSVLVYLGIRMLLTSVAQDRAKYKKMLMDWLVAMCLLFILHYIMSFALTMSEVITSMISNPMTGSVTVKFGSYQFTGNLMSYVRFMTQAEDIYTCLGFLALYIMLVIYNFKFTWIYLKRVVNMAFLTLTAPIITLTYPIDKVSDGKAQAFELWIREFAYNALLQPVHLFLYMVLLGSAAELAVNNPLYAVVCLGFMTAAEVMLKKYFGFSKASGGTIGTLAGAAGVTAMANKALMSLGKGGHGGNGDSGKVRTKDKLERQGKDTGANKGYNSFDKEDNQGLSELPDGEDEASAPQNGRNSEGGPGGGPEGGKGGSPEGSDKDKAEMSIDDQIAQEKAQMGSQDYRELGLSPQEWEESRRTELEEEQNRREQEDNEDNSEEPVPQGSPRVRQAMEDLGSEQQGPRTEDLGSGQQGPRTVRDIWRNLREEDKHKAYENNSQKRLDKIENKRQKKLDKESGETRRRRVESAYRTFKGVKSAGRQMAYKGVRGIAKTGAKVAIGGAIGATKGLALGAAAGVIGATTGDAEKAIGAALSGFAIGASSGARTGARTGGKVFEGTIGRVAKNTRTVKDAYGAGKYGSAIEARNAKADKEHIKSEEHKEEYERYFKEGKYHMTKEAFDKATTEYRQAGITDAKTIRKALHLEQQYREKNKDGGDAKTIRGKVQNIVQTYDGIDRKAVYGSDANATEATLKNIENQIGTGNAKQKRAIANEILQGYRDWNNVS